MDTQSVSSALNLCLSVDMTVDEGGEALANPVPVTDTEHGASSKAIESQGDIPTPPVPAAADNEAERKRKKKLEKKEKKRRKMEKLARKQEALEEFRSEFLDIEAEEASKDEEEDRELNEDEIREAEEAEKERLRWEQQTGGRPRDFLKEVVQKYSKIADPAHTTKNGYYEEAEEEDIEDDEMLDMDPHDVPRAIHMPKVPRASGNVRAFVDSQIMRDVHAPFQVGSTPEKEGKMLMCYNRQGYILWSKMEDYFVIEVEYSDQLKMKRPIKLNDRQGFTLASLGMNCMAMAQAENQAGCLVSYKMLDTTMWGSHKEWTVQLPIGEKVLGLALGRRWCCVVTEDYWRVYTFSGIERFVFSVKSNFVTCCSNEANLLVFVYDLGLPTLRGSLRCDIYDVDACILVASDIIIPVSPSSNRLIWIGFSDEGLLSVYDSSGVISIYSAEFGNQWIPVLDKKQKPYWPISIQTDQLVYLSCEPGSVYPPLVGLSSFLSTPLQVPASQGPNRKHVEEYLRNSFINAKRKAIAEATPTRVYTSEVSQSDMALDACLLALYEAALENENTTRALDIATLFNLKATAVRATRLAYEKKQPELSDKVNAIVQRRFGDREQKSGLHGAPVSHQTPVLASFKDFQKKKSEAVQPKPVLKMSGIPQDEKEPTRTYSAKPSLPVRKASTPPPHPPSNDTLVSETTAVVKPATKRVLDDIVNGEHSSPFKHNGVHEVAQPKVIGKTIGLQQDDREPPRAHFVKPPPVNTMRKASTPPPQLPDNECPLKVTSELSSKAKLALKRTLDDVDDDDASLYKVSIAKVPKIT